MNTQTNNRKKIMYMVTFAILLAIEILFAFTVLGSINFTQTVVATLAMLPIIITAILMGPIAGGLMGFFAGTFSFIVWSMMPPNPLIAFAFTPFYSTGNIHGNIWSVVICFVPRIMVGIVTGALFRFFSKVFANHKKADVLPYMLSGIIGSLVNTFGFIFGVYFFFRSQMADALTIAITAVVGVLITVFLTNGVPELIIAGLVAYSVCKPIRKYLTKSEISIFSKKTEGVVVAISSIVSILIYVIGAIVN